MHTLSPLLLDATPAAAQGGGLFQMLIMMGLMFAVFYFLLIRPQQKRAKDHQNMVNALKKGDQVLTRGGIFGTVSGVQDNVVTLEVQEKVRLRVHRGYIESKVDASKPGKGGAPATTE